MLILGLIPFTADDLAAEEHVIIILQSAYFPDRVDIASGDIVRFVNASGRPHGVSSSEALWTSAPIAAGGEMALQIDADMVGRFHGWTTGLIQGRLDLRRVPVGLRTP
ncbi:cupredoxin domain-containing protein [Roseobacter sp. A03A-229]